jgi:hypothetical protein
VIVHLGFYREDVHEHEQSALCWAKASLEPSNSLDEVSVFCILVNFQPVIIGAVDAGEIVTANGDGALHDVEENTYSHDSNQ